MPPARPGGNRTRVTPSGTQFELAHGAAHACAVEVGGGLRTFTVDGVDVVLGYAVDEQCTAGRGQVLAPWPNRIVDGRYTFDGVEHVLPITERERSTAIHGLVRWASWSATACTESSVTLAHMLYPQPGYPFTLGLEVNYELGDDGLRVTTRAENLGDTACPFGVGHHPYIACRVDDLFGDAKLDETRTGLERFPVGDIEVWWDACCASSRVTASRARGAFA